MTWQRIDENTFIDGSLVTCVEYQLFIDEMCEAGKYYQPDHWTSYQFPRGQAREPILGLRHSDAVAFCEWLTKRNTGDWYYRLLTDIEVEEYSLKPKQDLLLLGYWIIGNEKRQSRFSKWIGFIPYNLRGINISDPPNFLASKLRSNYHHRLGDTSKKFELELTHARDRAYELDLDRTLDRFANLNRVHQFSVYRFTRDLAKTHDLEIACVDSLELAFKLFFSRIDSYKLEHPKTNSSYEIEHLKIDSYEFDHALDLYIDILTLRERIAGRSPAFEGIRLVKERIR
jgi:hypothetical protein